MRTSLSSSSDFLMKSFNKRRLEEHCREFGYLLTFKARQLESEGRTRQRSLDCYVAIYRIANHIANRGTLIQRLRANGLENDRREVLACYWAAHGLQSADRIKWAIDRIDMVTIQSPPMIEALEVEYVLLKQLITQPWAELGPRGEPLWTMTLAVLDRFTSEHARARRLRSRLLRR